ncbi:Metaxin-1-like [Homarus americanus]|uniref:Metaxin-1-like n=1 Tax=Homarus americanus TaxID=6706 RepID=A0A8J5N1M8_HOMAM|nr:Metaxin-1-like [Homarus americanus]
MERSVDPTTTDTSPAEPPPMKRNKFFALANRPFTPRPTPSETENFSCDYELSAKQCSEVVAYEHLLLEKLYPALMYLWWVEPKSYCDVIHKWYFSSIPFPYKLWYPRRYHIGQCDLINSMFDDPDDSQLIETEVDLKVPVLQNHIKACPNLSRYVSKAIQRFFPAEGHRGTEARDSPAKDDVPNKGRNLLLSGLVAFSAMFGYAIAAGLVQVDMGEPPVEEEYDYEYEDYNDAGSSGN